jgi:DNA-binding IclR family transcriptional regulator
MAAIRTLREKRAAPVTVSETRGNSTIMIGVSLLQVMAEFQGPASLTAIAEKADIWPSRAYRYLRALCDSGLLTQDEESGHYDLGPLILNLGLTALGRLDPVRQAVAMLPELTRSTGLVSVVSIWGTHGPIAVRCEHGNVPIQLRVREGLTLPLLQTAAGKIFLTYLPASQTERLLVAEMKQNKGVMLTGERVTHRKLEQLKEEIRRIRLVRSATHNPIYISLAAPVFDREGQLQLTLSLIGVKGGYDSSLNGEPARQLRTAADGLSRQLGAPIGALR